MKSSIFLFLSIVLYCQLQAQNSKRFSLEVNYGLNGNFFVRSYDETEGPANKTNFYNKNFLGTVGGIEMNYHLNDHSSLIGGYSRSTNAGKKNYAGNVNGVNLFIKDFNIRHSNDFYQLGYERRFNKSNPMFKYHFGVVYATMHQQEISVENFANDIIVEERNFKNSRLEEGGIFGGIHFQKKIDTRFELGIRVRAYYFISVQTFEAVTFTPTLTYLF